MSRSLTLTRSVLAGARSPRPRPTSSTSSNDGSRPNSTRAAIKRLRLLKRAGHTDKTLDGYDWTNPGNAAD